MTAFIDGHVHPPVPEFLDGPMGPYLEQLSIELDRPIEAMEPAALAEFYRSKNAKAVLLGWDTETVTNRRPFGNTDIAALVAVAPDVFIGFGSVDPTKGAAAVASVHEAARLGLRGLSVHPAAQGTGPGDRFTLPVWEAAADHALVVLIHTGYTRIGAGSAGGGGIRLEPARPVHVDAVAARFPSLSIILAHNGELWRDEALAIARHKRNISLCLSGQSPKQFGPELTEVIAGPLTDRCHFGSDFPFGSPDEWLTEWDALGMAPEITRRVLHDNLGRLLGLVRP